MDDIDKISAYLQENSAVTPQALSRTFNISIENARKSLLEFVKMIGVTDFKVTYCVHRLKVGFFLCSAEEMMEADGDEVILFAVEKRSAEADISLYFEEMKAARAVLEQSNRDGKLLTCQHYGINPLDIQVREAHLSKKRILVSLWKPPTTTTQPAIDTTITKQPANITELEEEDDTDIALRPPEPDLCEPPTGCELADVSCLDDIMSCAPQKRDRQERTLDFTAIMRCVETVDLTKGVSVYKRSERQGRKAKTGRQMTLQACFKPEKS